MKQPRHIKPLFLLMALVVTQPSFASDCKTCHQGENKPANAPDYTPFFIDHSGRHHAFDIPYPIQADITASFNSPRIEGNMAYINSGSRTAGDNENIPLTASGNDYLVTCTSCHNPDHAATPKRRYYLRMDNDTSQLCSACHRK